MLFSSISPGLLFKIPLLTGLHKNLTFVSPRTLSTERKGNPQNGRKIFANHVSDKGLLSRLYKELTQLKQTEKKGDPIEKWARDLIDIPPKKKYKLPINGRMLNVTSH